jgi:hypothetical protein
MRIASAHAFFPTTTYSMRTFRKYKRREDRFETNRVKMSRQRLRQILPELKRLNQLTEKDRRYYLRTCDGPFVDCMCECIKNLLKGRVPLKSKQLKTLRYKRLLRKVALKKTPRSERRRVLKRADLSAPYCRRSYRGWAL